MNEGYHELRSIGTLYVRNPTRMAQIVPPVPEPPLTDAERAYLQATHRKRKWRRILHNALLLLIVIPVGLSVAVAGGWLLVWKLECDGLNILWGGFCGLMMVYAIMILWKDSWEI